MNYFLGLDIGTFESKGIIVSEFGKVVAQAFKPHKMIVPEPGRAEQNADGDWWGDFVSISRELIRKSNLAPNEIKAVSTSAIGPCMLPVDKSGKPLMNGVLYGLDTRATLEIQQLNHEFGEEAIFNECGNTLTAQSVGPKILWLKNNRPEIFSKTHKFLTSTSYIVFKLTGQYVIDHCTGSGFTPFYSVKSKNWSLEFIKDIISLDALPKLLWTNEVAGTVTREAAIQTGLEPGTPVTTGTLDAAAEALSTGVRETGDMMLMYGSTTFMIQLTKDMVVDRRLWYAPWLTNDLHSSMGGLATSGTLTHWFASELARELNDEDVFSTLIKEAEKSKPGANGLILLPHFSGERTPIHDPLAKGSFFGLNLTHTRGDMFRALIEGIAFGTAHVFETFRELGLEPKRIMAVGGGTRNHLWLRATSDICAIDQIVPKKTVGASLGNAFLAANALGIVELDEIEKWNPIERRVKHNKLKVYQNHYRQFRNLYEQTKEISTELEPSV